MGTSLSMDAPALIKREGLVPGDLGAEKRAELIKEATEPRSGGKGFKPSGRPMALLNAPVVLLQIIIQVVADPVRHPAPKDIPDGLRERIIAAGGNTVQPPVTAQARRKNASDAERTRVRLSRTSIKFAPRSMARYKSHHCHFREESLDAVSPKTPDGMSSDRTSPSSTSWLGAIMRV
jgi:hypothetical protein